MKKLVWALCAVSFLAVACENREHKTGTHHDNAVERRHEAVEHRQEKINSEKPVEIRTVEIKNSTTPVVPKAPVAPQAPAAPAVPPAPTGN